MGLFRTAARASVAAHVVGNVQRRQGRKWAQEDAAMQQTMAPIPVVAPAPPVTPAPAVAPTPSATDTMIAQLTDLGRLRDQGILTPEEFEAQKQRILSAH